MTLSCSQVTDRKKMLKDEWGLPKGQQVHSWRFIKACSSEEKKNQTQRSITSQDWQRETQKYAIGLLHGELWVSIPSCSEQRQGEQALVSLMDWPLDANLS